MGVSTTARVHDNHARHPLVPAAVAVIVAGLATEVAELSAEVQRLRQAVRELEAKLAAALGLG